MILINSTAYSVERTAKNLNKVLSTPDAVRGTQYVRRNPKNAQVSVEFMFCMMIVLLMIYATVMIFRWAGVDLIERRRSHDFLLYSDIQQSYGSFGAGPAKQIDPYFYEPVKMNAIFNNTGMLQ